MSRNGDEEMTDAENDALTRRGLPYLPNDADRAVWAGFPATQHAFDRMHEKAVNTALIEATLADIDAQEERCRLSIRYFKHRPILRVYTDDLRRLLELAKKGNQ